MRLYFKQRLFSWLDSYDIFDESGRTAYTVKGRLAWGHRLEIYDACGRYLGRIQERVFRFLPTFELYEGENCIGRIKREFTFFKPCFTMDCNGWQVQGNFMEWNYSVTAGNRVVGTVSKEIFHLTDTYVIDTASEDALRMLMVVLAIDAEKCSRN